jgi:hypothetical protein
MPQSKESPAATVCTALRAEEPEEAGRSPPDERLPLATLTEVVTPEGDDELAALGSLLAAPDAGAPLGTPEGAALGTAEGTALAMIEEPAPPTADDTPVPSGIPRDEGEPVPSGTL